MVVGVIPARIGSKRFPKKILADINGKPMIAHVAERAMQSKLLEKIVIAIDAEETKQALSDFDFDLVMTSKDHSSGTDRVAQVAKEIDSLNGLSVDYVSGGELNTKHPSLRDDLISEITYEQTDNKVSLIGRNSNIVEIFINRNFKKTSC